MNFLKRFYFDFVIHERTHRSSFLAYLVDQWSIFISGHNWVKYFGRSSLLLVIICIVDGGISLFEFARNTSSKTTKTKRPNC